MDGFAFLLSHGTMPPRGRLRRLAKPSFHDGEILQYDSIPAGLLIGMTHPEFM